jgi:putative DNA primase/helicase
MRLVKDGGEFAQENLWRKKLVVSGEKKKIVECYQNVARFLECHPRWKGCLAFDEFREAIVLRKEPDGIDGFPVGEWADIHNLRLGTWLSDEENLTCRGQDAIYHGLVLAARERDFHPVREWLEKLVWDQVPRMDTWLTDFAGVEGCRNLDGDAARKYVACVGRFFLKAMVARIFEPGCIMRSVPIIEGEQERGKSTLLRILADPWFSDTPIMIGDKDAYLALKGKWLMEIAELQAFNRAEATWVKAFISSPEDHYRAPYERKPNDHKRQIVFAATTNEYAYLKDPSGHSRFWPLLSSGDIKLDELRAVREQLFAEALAAYLAGGRRHPDRDEQRDLFAHEQDAREIEDPWRTNIRSFLEIEAGSRCTMRELMKAVGVDMEKADSARSISQRLGRYVAEAGWIRRQGTNQQYFYERPKLVVAPAAKGEDDYSDVPF